MSRIDVVGQNGNDGLHYDKEWDQMKPAGKEFEYELDKSSGEVVKKYTLPYSPEFTFWYERFFCQSPSMCALQYDDEKMWEAWKAGQQALGQMIKDNAELGSQK